MSALSNWPLSSGSCRFDLHDRCTESKLKSPLVEQFMLNAAGFYDRAAGHLMRRHEHDEHILAYVTSGHGYLQIDGNNDQIYEIGPGSLWWIPPNVPHYYYAATDQPWSLFWAHVQKPEANALYNLIGFDNKPTVKVGVSPTLIQGFERILLNLRDQPKSISQLAAISAKMRAWLCDAAVILEQQKHQQNSLLEGVNRIFEERLEQKLSLDEIAAEFNLSKSHFSRKYKKLTGKSPSSAFTEYKINCACQLMRDEKRTISQISYQLGFMDETYFTKVFTKHIGMSPSRYRTSLAN